VADPSPFSDPPLPVDEDKCKASVEKFACDSCINISKFDSQEKIGAELKKLSPEGFDLFWVSDQTAAAMIALARTHRLFSRRAMPCSN